ncbi:MAG: GNAT family N-acetyltransferase, partial [Candidatus Eisenbacteria bacterium]|nr:GNAT family N-acetyltransferase [Candidatus Latescibacterota bacterium]MBD3301683.1 GNAT family N-acetyltransferase [Candidatus Eisenbacteria bacterium]
VWYAPDETGEPSALALLYTGTALPVLLALDADPEGPIGPLVEEVRPLLPPKLYAHLSGDLADRLAPRFEIEPHGGHWKMALARPEALEAIDPGGVVPLGLGDLPELLRFYEASYPGHWFERRMLEWGRYVGIREKGRLMSVAGVHVLSPGRGVAALGNIATRPEARGRGLAARATAALCRDLLGDVDRIGLNVKRDNDRAVSCYERLGFVRHALYAEYSLTSG